MISSLNHIETGKQISGVNVIEVTDKHIPSNKKPTFHTVLLNHHQNGTFHIRLIKDKTYLYITNFCPGSLNYRLNKQNHLNVVPKNQKVALTPKDFVTFFVSYIDHNNKSQTDQLQITLLDDLSVMFEINHTPAT